MKPHHHWKEENCISCQNYKVAIKTNMINDVNKFYLDAGACKGTDPQMASLKGGICKCLGVLKTHQHPAETFSLIEGDEWKEI